MLQQYFNYNNNINFDNALTTILTILTSTTLKTNFDNNYNTFTITLLL